MMGELEKTLAGKTPVLSSEGSLGLSEMTGCKDQGNHMN